MAKTPVTVGLVCAALACASAETDDAGPIRTLASAGISDFRKMLDYYTKIAPLGRGVSIDEVGNAAAFLCSDLASGITGEITYVDGGFNTVALGKGLMEGPR